MSPKPPDVKADCYSSGERTMMVWFQNLRQAWLRPFLRSLANWGIAPDHLTILSLLCGLAFCPLYFWNVQWAFGMLLLHVVLDGLDGPLARYSGVASRRGSFADTLCDQTVVAATTLTVMTRPDPLIHVWAGGVYIFLYSIVVAFAMIRNALGIPYSWLVRPRFIVYSWLALECFVLQGSWLGGSINYILWLFNGLLGFKMLTGYWRIRQRI